MNVNQTDLLNLNTGEKGVNRKGVAEWLERNSGTSQY